MKVTVIGQGYVGQTVAFYAAQHHKVIGLDINENLVFDLNNGISRVEGLDNELIKNALLKQNYKASNDSREINGSDVVVIAVPTPLDEARNPDLSFLERACDVISKNLNNKALIINESTSYPGTVRNFIKTRIESKSPHIHHFYAVSPERVDPGRSDWNQTNTPRLFSGLTPEATLRTREFYSQFCENLVEVSSPEVAEAAKLFENSFRQVNIALVNEFAKISHALGISVRETLDAANTKPYGFMKFEPSAGVGGHCIPVDPSYLASTAREYGVNANFIELANEVNLSMGKYVVERIKADNSGTISGKKVQIIGVAYKSNVSDVRETPANEIHEALLEAGAIVTWHDPLVDNWRGQTSSAIGADIGIIVTMHDIFKNLDLKVKFDYLFDTTGKVQTANQL